MKENPAPDGSLGITSDDLYSKLKTTDSLLLLDLRDKGEYESGHIQSAVLASSYRKTDFGVLPDIETTDKEIMLICRDGIQSGQYAKNLSRTGAKIHYLVGGMDGWNHSLYHPSYLVG